MKLYRKAVWDWLHEHVIFGCYPDRTVTIFVDTVIDEQEPRGDTVASCGAKIMHVLLSQGAVVERVAA